MNLELVKSVMADEYPGVVIKETTIVDGEVTELVGEFDRAQIHSERDVAIVVADKSGEHWHKVITEEYVVLRGSLKVHRDDEISKLKEGDTIVIEPGTRHWVEGDETWFYCFSVPDWFPGDYYTDEEPLDQGTQ